MAGDAERLRSIAQKYGAFGTLVAVARRTVDPRSGAPTIQVEMTRHTPTQDSRTLVRSFTGKKADDVGAILAQAVGVLAAQAEEDWKRSEERRVGKECVSTCSSRWEPKHSNKTHKRNETSEQQHNSKGR